MAFPPHDNKSADAESATPSPEELLAAEAELLADAPDGLEAMVQELMSSADQLANTYAPHSTQAELRSQRTILSPRLALSALVVGLSLALLLTVTLISNSGLFTIPTTNPVVQPIAETNPGVGVGGSPAPSTFAPKAPPAELLLEVSGPEIEGMLDMLEATGQAESDLSI